MKKIYAVKHFGGTAALASALSITRQAIYQWPDDLPQDCADEISGAAQRLGLPTIKNVGSKPRCRRRNKLFVDVGKK